MAKMKSKVLDKVIVYQNYEYNGIKVMVGHRKEVRILPVGQTTWFNFDKDQIMEEVRNMPSDSTVLGIPRDTMWEYLNYDFEKSFWG